MSYGLQRAIDVVQRFKLNSFTSCEHAGVGPHVSLTMASATGVECLLQAYLPRMHLE